MYQSEALEFEIACVHIKRHFFVNKFSEIS